MAEALGVPPGYPDEVTELGGPVSALASAALDE